MKKILKPKSVDDYIATVQKRYREDFIENDFGQAVNSKIMYNQSHAKKTYQSWDNEEIPFAQNQKEA